MWNEKISTEVRNKMYVTAILPKKVMDHRSHKKTCHLWKLDFKIFYYPVIPNSADVVVFSVSNCILLDF